ncbi:uncharacterized protein LOC108100263 isoform X2 [Drosophila ficusphila]|uniref:uncharacterized protein LOC108100263 isoform X2 n=1 Tax=Drosophila ficusphila TaxID=30025 RepID=UPI0007E775C4|nr:uncharacterized protein LOC108100263 isoform X2 [Drosophila ficusphila]
MSRVYKMAWSGVRMFLKLTSQRCQLISLGSKTEVPGGPGPGIFESDVLASKSNASHMENLFTKWIEDNNAIHESWQRFFKDLVGDTAMTTPLQYDPNPNPNSIQSFNKHLGNGFNISSPSERVATSPEKLKQTKKNGTKTGDPHSDKEIILMIFPFSECLFLCIII